MFVVTGDGVIATDPINPTAATAMRDEIRKVTDQPVKYLVYSHEHWDHVLGGEVFRREGAKIVSQRNCLAAFERMPNRELAMPDLTFGERHDLTLGKTTVQLHYFGRNHGNCMTVMLLPKEKILYIVDIVTPNLVGFRSLPDFFPSDWARSLREIEKLDFERIIPDHGPASAPASAVRETREYIEDLIAAVKEAMQTTSDVGKIQSMVKLPKYENWYGYKDWLAMNVERVFRQFQMGW